MAASPLEHAEEARAALRAIVSDPEHGPGALSSGQTMANLLHDLLPDAPREAGLLTAAASAGLPEMLRGYAAQGVDESMAVGLAAAAFAGRTAFAAESCEWVATELAIALGMESGAKPPAGTGLRLADGDPASAARSTADPVTARVTEVFPPAAAGIPDGGGADPASQHGGPRGHRLIGYGIGVVAVAVAVAVAFALGSSQGASHAGRPLAGSGSSRATASASSSPAISPSATPPAPAAPMTCGTATTAADVAVTVVIVSGDVSCGTAMAIEQGYDAALREGAAPGNGGGGPVPVQDWICQAFATPEIAQTGEVSECTKGGSKIVTILPAPG